MKAYNIMTHNLFSSQKHIYIYIYIYIYQQPQYSANLMKDPFGQQSWDFYTGVAD